LRAAVILCGNPDGMLRGTRGNGRGRGSEPQLPDVELESRSSALQEPRERRPRHRPRPGTDAASEPETRALLALLDQLKPRAVVSLHSALACVDDSGASHLGKQLADRCALPFLTEIGYPTPGSMGTWAGERG
jgi:protein MpaA